MVEQDRRDPICGMTGTIQRHGRWFCSEGCVTKYAAACPLPARRWWRSQALWGVALVAAVLLIGQVWPAAHETSAMLWAYLVKSGWAVALGLVLGGLVDHYVPKEYISAWFAGQHQRTILTAAGLGFLASSCSHGCLALSIELFRKGASVPAVVTFLLASPWASLSLTLLLVSLMGSAGLLIVILALVVAVVTGLIFQRLERRGMLDRNPHQVPVVEGFSIWQDLGRRFRQRRWTRDEWIEDLRGVGRGAWGLAHMVVFWVAMGFTLSAVLGTVVPHGWWHRWVGPNALGLLITLGIATAVEVCSEGTAPLALELYRQSGALGNAFAFLMGGVVTDFTELSILWSNVGRRTVFWVLVVTLPQVLVVGYLLNLIVR